MSTHQGTATLIALLSSVLGAQEAPVAELEARISPPPVPLASNFGRAVSLDGVRVAIRPPGGAELRGFGSTLELDGLTLLVGTSYSAVLVYEHDGGRWSLAAEIEPPPTSPYIGGFGQSIALDGDTLIASSFPSVQVFARSSGTWARQGSLASASPIEGGSFGWSIAIDGDLAFVGAPTGRTAVDAPEDGLVHVYERSGRAGAGPRS